MFRLHTGRSCNGRDVRYTGVPPLVEMGATPGDSEREMRMLLTDDAYWHEWSGTDWLYRSQPLSLSPFALHFAQHGGCDINTRFLTRPNATAEDEQGSDCAHALIRSLVANMQPLHCP